MTSYPSSCLIGCGPVTMETDRASSATSWCRTGLWSRAPRFSVCGFDFVSATNWKFRGDRQLNYIVVISTSIAKAEHSQKWVVRVVMINDHVPVTKHHTSLLGWKVNNMRKPGVWQQIIGSIASMFIFCQHFTWLVAMQYAWVLLNSVTVRRKQYDGLWYHGLFCLHRFYRRAEPGRRGGAGLLWGADGPPGRPL